MKKKKPKRKPAPSFIKKQEAGRGLSDRPSDYSLMFDSDYDTDDWLDAVAAIDRENDIEPLVRLFRSGRARSKDADFVIDDLLERRRKRKRGKRRSPIYRPPDKVLRLFMAEKEWREIQETQTYLRASSSSKTRQEQRILNLTQYDVEQKYGLAEDELTDFFQRQIKHARPYLKRANRA